MILDRCIERKGRPTDPDRFSELDLVEREASYGRSQFTLQFQLDTTLSDMQRFHLKLADLIVMEVNQNAPENLVLSSGAEYRINYIIHFILHHYSSILK